MQFSDVAKRSRGQFVAQIRTAAVYSRRPYDISELLVGHRIFSKQVNDPRVNALSPSPPPSAAIVLKELLWEEERRIEGARPINVIVNGWTPFRL